MKAERFITSVLLKTIVPVGIVLLPLNLSAQNNGRWQLLLLGGVHAPGAEEVQNIYGNSPFAQVGLAAPLGERGRLRLAANHYRRDGDPYYQAKDFYAGETGELALTGLMLMLETRGPTAHNPRLYAGAGVVYVFGTEKIDGQPTSTGNGLGLCVALAPEMQFSKRISLAVEAGYRLLEGAFENGKDRYRFNLSGGSLLIGLAIHFAGGE
jgi:hypothetical protein